MYSEHSVQAYLRRKTTQELENMLKMIFITGTEIDNAYGISEILNVLQERNVDISTVITPEIAPAYQNFLNGMNFQNEKIDNS